MEEIWKFWKEVKHSNQHFKKGDILTVSDCGRVKCNGEFYKCPINNGGYYHLCHIPLHRIIAEKFLSDYYENCEIDHKDCNKLNNMVTNLLVCHNRKENMANPLTRQHMRECQREAKKNPLTIKHFIEGSHKKSVLQYTKDNKFITEYISVREAERQTKIAKSSIIKCCQCKIKSAGGYIWRYKKEE